MPIVFSAVASDRNIVSNFASCDGNFTEIAEQVLSKLPPCNNKMTYSHGIYLLHYIAEDDFLYFCITDKTAVAKEKPLSKIMFSAEGVCSIMSLTDNNANIIDLQLCQRSRAFLFLNEIQRRFITSKQTDDFTTTLAAEMYRYSEDYSTIVIRKGELDELNSIGVGCSESLLGEKILYINNPDVISYSTISHVTATPGLVSVSAVCSTPEELSVVRPTTEAIAIINPTAQRISISRPIPEGLSAENTTVESILVSASTSEEINIKDSTPQNVEGSPTDKITTVNQTLENTSVELTPERMRPTTESKSAISLNQARISSLSPITESKLEMSPRLYIVIVGMIILVIAMSVYALGPISCVVVTGVGIYSLLRSYMGTKDKSD